MKDEYKEMVCRVRFIDGVPAKTYLSDVEIVRCKDCKYDYMCTHAMVRSSACGGIIYCPVEYCSEGDRRKE